jgi:hypothetical protein
MPELKIDVAAENAAYLALLPKHKAVAAKSMTESKALGFSMVETAEKMTAMGVSLCADWPGIKKNLVWGISLLDWVLPDSAIGPMMAFVEWVDTSIMQKMCAAPAEPIPAMSTKSAPVEPDPMHRGPQGGGGN